MDIPVIFPVGIVISFSRTAVQYIRDCRGVPTEYGDCCHPNSSRWCRDHIRSWPAVLQRSHRSTVCIDRQDSVSSYNLIWSYPQSLWLLVFSVWTPKALQSSRSLIVQPEQRRADFFKLCDAVTVEPLVMRYTIPKQRKGAGRYGSYEYESGAV